MLKNIQILIFLLALCAGPAQAAPEVSHFASYSDLDYVWIAMAAALVFFMQAGFLLLEAGSVRSKNSVNVAQKNLMDFIVSTVAFGSVGFMLMFGTSAGGWYGWESELAFFAAAEDRTLIFFLFQVMFCGTAATIMSGAVAERMNMIGYLMATLLIALVIYPVAGHWAWGGLLNGGEEPWLASRGFMDFAGSTVVHSVGAWVALACIIVIGPRIGKFDEAGKPRVLHGHSPVLATLGAIILWVGWLGFNAGSTLSGSGAIAPILANTVIAGGAGGLTLMIVGRVASGVFRPDATINGLLGGLVAITAGVDVMSSQSAFVVGAIGGVTVFVSHILLERVLKLDDPVGAIPVHGFAGAVGTICIAFFAPEESLLAGSRADQLAVQAGGVAVVFVWAFGVAFVALKCAHFVMGTSPDGGRGLRVPELHEREGLNQHEHNAPMGTGILQQAMAKTAFHHSGKIEPIVLDYGDEAYEMSELFNRIMGNIENDRKAEEEKYQRDKRERMSVEKEISEVVQACAGGDFSKRLQTEGRKDFLLELCLNINALCGSTDAAFQSIEHSLTALSKGDLTQTMEGAYGGQLKDIQNALNGTLETVSGIAEDLQHSVACASRGDFTQAVDLDGKGGVFGALATSMNSLCSATDTVVTSINDSLRAVCDGDLSGRIDGAFEGQLQELQTAVNTTLSRLRDIVDQFQVTVDAAGNGDFSNQIDLTGKTGFYAHLAGGLNALCSLSEAGLSDLVTTLRKVGDGDLTVRMEGSYAGRFDEISTAVRRMNTDIGGLLHSIEASAASASDNARAVAESSERVAQASAEQSETLAESRQALSALSEQSRATLENANSAKELCQSALEEADRGRQISQHLREQFNELKSTSSDIGAALVKIDEISLQTHLLSLNASVEAARASKSGQGFSVIAEEVRSLAASATDAAQEIRACTDKVRENVSAGAGLVDDTGQALAQIHAVVTQGTERVETVADNSKDQSEKVRDVAQQVSGVSEISDRNLSLAQGCAELGQALEGDAQTTAKMLSGFSTESAGDKLAA